LVCLLPALLCLQQGGVPAVLPIIAWEWQKDGYLKPGTIVAVRLKRYLLN
jgi:hypothetical protein